MVAVADVVTGTSTPSEDVLVEGTVAVDVGLREQLDGYTDLHDERHEPFAEVRYSPLLARTAQVREHDHFVALVVRVVHSCTALDDGLAVHELVQSQRVQDLR